MEFLINLDEILELNFLLIYLDFSDLVFDNLD